MEALKNDAIEAIAKLPESATIDDIMYRLYVIDKIRKGKEAVSRGEIISTSDLQKEVAKW
ncbi:MAG: hypothetical protein C0417_08170 [Chlorobiaceae bacterium]|jgi:hypothetical protein|nr:hypothetical protein [Chlorobiaceae bacterium]